MKKLKKALTVIMSLVLVIAMVGTSCVFADAGNEPASGRKGLTDRKEFTGRFVYDGHGQFSLKERINQSDGETVSSIEKLHIGSIIDAVQLQNDEEVFKIPGTEKYLIKVCDDVYLLADKLFFDASNLEFSFKNYSDYALPESILSAIKKAVDLETKECGSANDIVLYAPCMNIMNQDTNLSALLRDAPGGSYYYYNGYKMSTYVMGSDKAITEHKSLGYNSDAILAAIKDLVLNTAGMANSYVSLIVGGGSLLQRLHSIWGTSISFTSQDTVNTTVYGIKYRKFVYVQDPVILEWYTSLVCYRYFYDYTDIYTQWISNHRSDLVSNTLEGNYYSHDYSNPSASALQSFLSDPNNTQFDGSIYVTVGTTQVSLGW